MTKRTSSKTATPLIPDDIKDLFGKRPLIFGEDPELYDALLSRAAVAVNPTDIIEWLYLKDVVDITWEIQRLRRFQAAMINNGRKKAAGEILAAVLDEGKGAMIGPKEKTGWAHQFLTGNNEIKEVFFSQMATHGLDNDSIMAAAFNANIPTLEIMDRMLAVAEARRDKMLREIENRREILGRRLRDKINAEANGDLTLAPDCNTSAEIEATRVGANTCGT